MRAAIALHAAAIFATAAFAVRMAFESPEEPVMWCASEDHTLSCDNSERIHIKAAFFNRNKEERPDCAPFDMGEGKEVSCQPNATDKVAVLCEGTAKCTVPASSHYVCADDPFTLIRVSWECSSKTKEPKSAGTEGKQSSVEELTPPRPVVKCRTGEASCKHGSRVQCPGTGVWCAGNSCCPRHPISGNKTFSCPSAADEYNLCELKVKVEDCCA